MKGFEIVHEIPKLTPCTCEISKKTIACIVSALIQFSSTR